MKSVGAQCPGVTLTFKILPGLYLRRCTVYLIHGKVIG